MGRSRSALAAVLLDSSSNPGGLLIKARFIQQLHALSVAGPPDDAVRVEQRQEALDDIGRLADPRADRDRGQRFAIVQTAENVQVDFMFDKSPQRGFHLIHPFTKMGGPDRPNGRRTAGTRFAATDRGRRAGACLSGQSRGKAKG